MILVGLDGSKNAEKILPLVLPLLRRPKARGRLVTVLPPGDDAPAGPWEAALERIASRLAKSVPRPSTAVLRGDPATALLREAERRGAELIAVASHGLGGGRRWVFGSTAQKILRGSPRAVLVARSFQSSAEPVARVLVPLDGSVGAEAALPAALEAARAWKARAVLLYVGPDREKRRVSARFGQIAKAEKSVEIEALLDEGDPAERIVHHAERRPGTLIAMGSHARTGVSRWVFGSVAEKILQSCRAPLLVTRR